MDDGATKFYLGVCVQNNDPEKRGRIKIFVPHISTSLYKINRENVDKIFKFPDASNNPDLSNVIEELKRALPWAEYAGPIFGGNASGRYNAVSDKGTTADSNEWNGNQVVENGRPLQRFINSDGAFPDAFNETNVNRNKFVNYYSYQYTPSDYSDLARGTFSIPNVGAHVWLWYKDGDTHFPVYFASSYGQEDFKRIYTMNQDVNDPGAVDYPTGYESKSSADGASYDYFDTTTFRAKHVINTNKHSIELIDTDQREILKFTHFSGSFKEFTNYANIEFASNNDQKMVIGDQFLTVRKNQNIFVAQCQDNIIEQDQYIKIGIKIDSKEITAISTILKDIHNIKRLFDKQRAKYSEAPTLLSSLQDRIGVFVPCPLCNGIGSYKGYKCDVCNSGYYGSDYSFAHNVGKSPSSKDGIWTIEPKKSYASLNALILEKSKLLAIHEKMLGIGGDQIIDINKNKIETIGLMFNDLIPYRVDPIGKLLIAGVYIAPCGLYETQKPSHYVETVAVDDYPGGDYNLTVYNKYKLLVGSRGIDIKTSGLAEINGAIVSINSKTQLGINANSEILIDGGELTSLTGKRVIIQTYGATNSCKEFPVVVNSDLHVTKDFVVKGNIMLGNETGVVNLNGHLTYIASNYETYKTDHCYIGPAVPALFSIPILGIINIPGSIRIKPHYHKVPSLPIRLYKKMSDFLINMMNINKCGGGGGTPSALLDDSTPLNQDTPSSGSATQQTTASGTTPTTT